jgi:hypothetical protein
VISCYLWSFESFNFVPVCEEGSKQGKRYEALLLDAGGTLLQTVKPIEETYATIGSKYGKVKYSLGRW